MYNLDSFSYWKDPLVRIKRIGIYPLDDAGKTQYYSKDSFVHHYLKMQIPEENLEFPINGSKKQVNEELKEEILLKETKNEIKEEQKEKIPLKESKNTIRKLKVIPPNEENTNKTILHTETNIGPIKINPPINLKNNTISNNTIRNNLNKRYNILEKKKKLKFDKINEFKSKSLSKNRNLKNSLFFGKTNHNTTSSNKMNMTQSFDKKARITGLHRTAKVNLKLPLIMEGIRNENKNIIQIIKTETKEMGENYNPYNFFAPHVNRTKRNIFGSLFHS